MYLLLTLCLLAVVACLVLTVAALRRRLITPWVMRAVSGVLPRVSETERIALEAGTVWWDAELFSGSPRFRELLDFPMQELSSEERSFLDGPVHTLCAMLDDWEVKEQSDLPQEAWQFIKEQRFFGMIIPKQYGGLGFSALAHSAVVTKLASRCVPAAVTVMVPNSLGPGELLLHYGTPEQKERYLPGLAQGLEIPCFALTEPNAGSDAAAIESTGVVCRGTYLGREALGLRLDWSKRYITLAPISTLIGLAFRMHDPEHLLGPVSDLGITVALIPADTPGIEIGERHDPLGVPFQNGPTRGEGVFVPLDAIIGGPRMAGQGWRMLMESLAAGRSISLPALSVGAAQLAARFVGAYCTVREQFGLPIGRFEGIQEPLARIGGLTYMMNAARLLTASSVDAGEKPAVLSAIVKCYLTEAMRSVVNDAMDIAAGAAICSGPRNPLARAHSAAPIGITVEGANIVTRSLIIFGQGALRCHPFLQHEMRAAQEEDLVAFDRTFFAHVALVFRNAGRAFFGGLSGARMVASPADGPAKRYLQRVTRASAAFALLADAAMLTLGSDLKRREKISGRLADALGHLYLASATLKRFCDAEQPATEVPFMRWSCQYCLARVDDALLGVLDNLPNRVAAFVLRPLIFPLGARASMPNDALGAEVAGALLDGRPERNHLTADIFIPAHGELGLGQLEGALQKVVHAAGAVSKVREAVKAGHITRGGSRADQLVLALQAQVIDANELRSIKEADKARAAAIEVDIQAPKARNTKRAEARAILKLRSAVGG